MELKNKIYFEDTHIYNSYCKSTSSVLHNDYCCILRIKKLKHKYRHHLCFAQLEKYCIVTLCMKKMRKEPRRKNA